MNFRKINIITGHYGSGKTNVSVNMALDLAEKGEKVTVVYLDIVNPYFRTADFKELFGEHNISLTVPTYANSNLDIPALGFDMN
ncbi:MAG: cobalamin biosynthesis protein CobQ, partial [Ruminiclostridium sp.]|nr:cobalamin biosynthesis protein CobQ [Ruminiclostridium sp.]